MPKQKPEQRGNDSGNDDLIVRPDPHDTALTERVSGIDHDGQSVTTAVTVERPLTLYLNKREIVTMMTICDYPEYLAVGYLMNQNMLMPGDHVTGVEYVEDIEAVIVRTDTETDFEDKLRKKTLTSGCAQGTVFGDVMEKFDSVVLPEDVRIKTSWLQKITHTVNTTPSLYLAAGAIHGCVLCRQDKALLYMEDVGRHNAVDKIAGYMYLNNEDGQMDGADKIFYTTGRLTSEMVIKTVQMGIPILVSRSGFTAWGVELARKVGLTLIGRARGKRFVALAGENRIIFDADQGDSGDDSGNDSGGEPEHLNRKGSGRD